MDAKRSDRYFKISSDTVENIRRIHNLDKPGRLEEAIKILRAWIQKQDHIIKKDYSNNNLEATLITCKGSVEKAKKQIDRLCTMKTLMPIFFSKTNAKLELPVILEVDVVHTDYSKAFDRIDHDTLIKKLSYIGIRGDLLKWFTSYIDNRKAVPLPKLTEDNYRVVVIEFCKSKDDVVITSEMLMQFYQFSIIFCEYIKANDYANGFLVMFDYRDVNLLELVTKINTVEVQQYVSILIEGYGARLKGLHYLSDSKAIEILVKLVKQLLSEKIASRLHVHKTLEDLHKAVPKEIFPVEYGGNERSIAKLHDEFIDELSSEKHVEFMKMMNKACSDETKRHAGKFNEEYMGMPGAFRNLSVD